jgi:Fic family protein
VSYESGHREVVFEPPRPHEAEHLLGETFRRYRAAKRDEVGHPLVLIGALVLDVLAIHPVADGNGRLARLLTTHELLAQGYGVARYVSLEQRIYDSKNTYYQRLYDSQQGWHTGQHTIWPWVYYLASILSTAYDDFEASVAAARDTIGNKQERVRRYILEQAPPEFRRREVERAMAGISPATIRLVLNELRDEGRIAVDGGGPGARWRRVSSTATAVSDEH